MAVPEAFSEAATAKRLSPRQTQVLYWRANGDTVRCLADRLGVSQSTVLFHSRNVMQRVHAVSIINALQIVLTIHPGGG